MLLILITDSSFILQKNASTFQTTLNNRSYIRKSEYSIEFQSYQSTGQNILREEPSVNYMLSPFSQGLHHTHCHPPTHPQPQLQLTFPLSQTSLLSVSTWIWALTQLLRKGGYYRVWGLPRWLSGKQSTCNAGDMGSIPGSGRSQGWEDPLEKEMATHSHILAWQMPWTEEPVGYSPWGCKESDTDMTEQLNNTNSMWLAWFCLLLALHHWDIFLL